jgi:hypothetical protein
VGGYLDMIEEQLRVARRGPGKDPSISLAALARIQRLTGHAMRVAVTECRAPEPPIPWRNLAAPAQMPWGTLYRQYHAGGRLVIGDDPHQP